MTNAIRPDAAASLLAKGEARSRPEGGVVRHAGRTATGSDAGDAPGDWRRNAGKVTRVKQGDLKRPRTVFMSHKGTEEPTASGVRASTVATKRGNARGAKGCREVET